MTSRRPCAPNARALMRSKSIRLSPILDESFIPNTLTTRARYVSISTMGGRSSIKRASGQRFDVIVFGLVDSQTALSVMSSLRLEFFLYSRESFEEALSLLDPQHGVFVVGFSIGWKDWVAQRIYHTLELANGAPPLAVNASSYLGTVSFVAGPGLNQAAARLGKMPETRSIGAELARADAKPVRDDWPFLYQNPRSFPYVYLGSLLLVLIIGAYFVRGPAARAGGEASRARLDWTMFFMGSAFLPAALSCFTHGDTIAAVYALCFLLQRSLRRQ
jgi:hypothetical protein